MGTIITELNEVLHIVSCSNYIYSSLGGDNVQHQLSNLLAWDLNFCTPYKLTVCYQAIFPGICMGFVALLSMESIRCSGITFHRNLLPPLWCASNEGKKAMWCKEERTRTIHMYETIRIRDPDKCGVSIWKKRKVL